MMNDNTITFVFNDLLQRITLSDQYGFTPTTTVLNYLRSRPGCSGTKEGCSEGDCGACTVVLGTLSRDGIRYKAVDSCLIFLPMLHGKQLITVEHVGSALHLHAVQAAMVESDGSQCGYCTPGFIMSMLALYKNHPKPSTTVIEDALTGNLCRCTGYRSIVKAATAACANGGRDHFTEKEGEVVRMLRAIKMPGISIECGNQRYFQPVKLSEAMALKARFTELLIINGATDVALLVNKQKAHLPAILDLSAVTELKEIERKGDTLCIGSGASLESVKRETAQLFPELHKILSVFGSKQIRELATLGGNLGSASPIADTPPVLMAYNARVVLVSANGKREMPVREFISGYRKTKIHIDELIHSVEIPFPAKNAMIRAYKISKRKDLDISTVNAGFSINLDREGIVKDICLAYGGMAAMTKRADKTEAFLLGKGWERKNVERAMLMVNKDFNPISDARAEKEGRALMARNLLLKFWNDTVNGISA